MTQTRDPADQKPANTNAAGEVPLRGSAVPAADGHAGAPGHRPADAQGGPDAAADVTQGADAHVKESAAGRTQGTAEAVGDTGAPRADAAKPAEKASRGADLADATGDVSTPDDAAADVAGDEDEDDAGPQTVMPREAEDDERALEDVQALIEQYETLQEEAHGDEPEAQAERARVVEECLTKLRERIDSLHPADAAYVLEALPSDERQLVWDLVKQEADGAVLLEVSEPVREALIESMTDAELVAAVKDLDADDVADLAEHLPEAVVEEVQRDLTPEEREQLRALMSYPEDSVGARMDFEFVRVREDVTLEVVLRYIRRFDELPQHTDQVFVVDRNGKLLGSLSIEQLLINEPDTEVSAVMHRDILTLPPDYDAGDAAQAFERYDLVSAPVVDADEKLIGRLTVDEVVDVIREEGDSEALSQAGLREGEDLFGSVWQSARNRWLWLAINLVTAFIASRVIGIFDGTIERVVALAALMPIVAGLAGNSGNQTMALMIRSIALGQINRGNFGSLLRKELTVALLNGIVWGAVAGAASWLLYRGSEHAELLAAAMGVAIVLNLLIGALLGVLVPVTLEKLGRDPAIGSSVLLTFSTDSLGFMIFLGLATLMF
ncbi:MAG: magnesium transporter [Lautropia sp.]|nr:magnesium transporter [Lautropia sp.]